MMNGKCLFSAAVAAGVVGFISFAACGAEVVIDPGVGVEASPEKISGTTDVTIKSGIVTMDPANDYTGTTTVSGATVIASAIANSGNASSFGASGAVVFDRAVLKYTGPAVTTDRPFWNSSYSVGITNRVQVWDIANDLTFSSAMTSSDGLVKLGAGTLTFKNTITLNVADIVIPNYAEQMVFPEDGTCPTQGMGLFGLYEGDVVFEKDASIQQNNVSGIRFRIGGWIADQGEQEPDVCLYINGGKTTCSSSGCLGLRHGIRDFNTPNGPAKAYLVINKNAVFQQSGGQAFNVGLNVDPPNNGAYNSDLRIIVNAGGAWDHSNSGAGLAIYRNKGQATRIEVNGGTVREVLTDIGNSYALSDADATVDIEVSNKGTWAGELLRINASKSGSTLAPVTIRVTSGGSFLIGSIQRKDSTEINFEFDGGTFGNDNSVWNVCTDKIGPAVRTVLPSFVNSATIGKGGVTLAANDRADVIRSNGYARRLGQRAIFAKGFTPSASLEPGEKDGGVTVTGETATNVVELAAVNTYEGPTVVKSGTLTLTGDGDITSSESVTVEDGATLLVASKDITLKNATFKTGSILAVWKGRRLVITGTVDFEPNVNIVLLNEDGSEVTDAEEFSFIQVPADQKEKLKTIGLKGLFGKGFYFQSTAFEEAGGNVTLKAVIAPRIDRDDDPEGEASWTGEGADKNLTTAANWQGGEAPSFAGGTLATFGKTDSAVVAEEKAFRGLHFGDNSFTFDADNEFAFILLKAAGLTFDTPQEGANNLIKFNAGIQSEVAQTLDIPAGDTVEMAGDLAFAKTLTVTGGGTLALTAPHSKFGPLLLNKDQTHKVIFSGLIDNIDGTITTSASSSASNAGTIQLTSSSTGSDALDAQVNILSNAVIRKAMYCTKHTSGGRMLYAAAGTTNILQGAWSSTSPQAYITAAKGADLIFDGGTYFGWSTHMCGSGRIIFRKKLTIGGGRLLTPGAGTLRFETTGNSWNERLTVNSTGMRIEYAVDDTFATSGGYLDLAESNVNATNEFFTTVQHFNNIHTCNSEKPCLRGDYGSKIVITGGCKANAAAWGTTNIACRVEGGLSLEADGTGDLILSTRSFASCGDLIATKGALRLESGAKWLNGTNFVIRGDGTMKFTVAGQVGENVACFRFSENGRANLAGNFTLKVRRATVDNGSGEVVVPPGTYDANSTGLMAGRITGNGKLLVLAYGPATPEYVETTEDMTAQGDWIAEVDKGCTHVVTVPQTGNGKIIKSGEGTLIFRTENSYTGGTVIEKGIVRVETNNVFGTGEVTVLGQRDDYTGNCRIDMIGWKLTTGDFTTPTVTITNDLHITGSSSRTYPAIISYNQNARWGGKITAEQDFCFLDDRATTYECAGAYSSAQDRVLSLSFGDIEVKGAMIHDGWARFRFDGKVNASALLCTLMRIGEGGSSNWKATYHFQDDVAFGSVTNQARNMFFYKKLTIDGAHNLPVDYGNGYVQGGLSLAGTESTIGGFSDCAPLAGCDMSKKWLVQPRTGAATLTLTGVAGETELTTYYAFVGALSLTMDAPGCTQIFAGRTNTMSGAIWVKNGTMKLTEGTKFANISSLTVEAGAQFIDESGVEGALAGLKNLSLATGAVLDLPEGTKLNLSTLTIDGVRAAPGNGYTHEHYPAIPAGVTINVTSVQPATTVAVWTGAMGDGKMSTLGNWLVNGEVPASLDLTSGTTTVSIEGGTEMIPDVEGIRIHSITNNSTEGTFYVGAVGKTLYVDGQIISINKSLFGLRGTIAGAKGVLQSFAATENGATGVTCINAGSSGKVAVRFAGVTLMKPAYFHVNLSGVNSYLVEANTTNVLLCAACNSASGGNAANVGEGALIEFAGGLSQVNRPIKQGAGTLKISGVAVAQSKGYNIEGGTLELACPGNVFKAYDEDYNWGIRIGAATDSTLKFDCSYTLADNDLEQINFVSSKEAKIDFGCTTQLVSRFFGNNTHAKSALTGGVGSMLEVKGGTKWETGNKNFIGLTNSVQITGGLGFHYLGNGPTAAKNPAAPAGSNDVYVLKGKAFATTGSLEVSGGTLELAADATWRNGACFAANGEGLLRFTAAGQVGSQAVFRFAGNGQIEIPAGVTYRCTAIDVEGYELIETGVFDKDSTGAMAGRIIGDGSLKVGRRGTMLLIQ